MRKLAGQSVFFSFLLAACASTTAISSAADASLLERDVLPVLTKNCLGCHGGLVKEGGLDLRTLPAMLKGGESGPAVESGKADASELWKRIANDEMPSGDDREKLSAADKAVI
ncbi:MAG: c-type cytochrome domain-containing protein, partial [Pirellulaceae bacterium]|nr:c-type cytochrome domain-containing protein [Pirellulaceae bacterium]